MPQYFLRVEGVNLANVLDDTDDLSTRRGGGLMLLNAVRQMPTTFNAVTLKPIATGASVGLFEFDADDPKALAERVRTHFRHTQLKGEQENDILPLSHGTFVVDVVHAGPDADADVQLVMACNRWQQLQSPTVALAGLWKRDATAECYHDRVRPAVKGKRLPKHREETDPKYDASISVHDRHHYGRDARQRFYRAELGEGVHDFTDEFAQIADRSELGDDVAASNTDGKIAVLYVDGNKFGRRGREALKVRTDAYRQWSQGVRDHHKHLLESLLARADADVGWQGTNNEGRKALRLETLLWGGDEILWVVPAWKGWELAELFFGHGHVINGQPVTYAGGLVFCHTKAPIANVVKLAKRLGDVAKHAGKDRHGLAYEVLESFDDITSDLTEHREKWLPVALRTPEPRPAASRPDPLVIDPAKLPAFLTAARAIAAATDFPMRQLYRLCKVWREPGKFETPEADRAAALTRLRGCEVGARFLEVEAAFRDDPVGWLHLLNVLPYLPSVGGNASESTTG